MICSDNRNISESLFVTTAITSLNLCFGQSKITEGVLRFVEQRECAEDNEREPTWSLPSEQSNCKAWAHISHNVQNLVSRHQSAVSRP